ncbi:hypothetical protein QFC24_000405 [Naganishia onofrii]|uniref:Uncharacterized protein n=1 Tax=Naganishia onofrii TaxID=1851511 RepID=A0ACC2XW23_9TREE|nr:hypothetical protein QFC24_000405 [Naganishia onofrii]
MNGNPDVPSMTYKQKRAARFKEMKANRNRHAGSAEGTRATTGGGPHANTYVFSARDFGEPALTDTANAFGATQARPTFGATGTITNGGLSGGSTGTFGLTGRFGAAAAPQASSGGLSGIRTDAFAAKPITTTFGAVAGTGTTGGHPLRVQPATTRLGALLTTTTLPQPVTNGSLAPFYTPLREKDGTAANAGWGVYNTITCMTEYRGTSLEEIRVQDYAAGRKVASAGSTTSTGFEAQPAQGGLFGFIAAQTNTFGQPAAGATGARLLDAAQQNATNLFCQPPQQANALGQPAQQSSGLLGQPAQQSNAPVVSTGVGQPLQNTTAPPWDFGQQKQQAGATAQPAAGGSGSSATTTEAAASDEYEPFRMRMPWPYIKAHRPPPTLEEIELQLSNRAVPITEVDRLCFACQSDYQEQMNAFSSGSRAEAPTMNCAFYDPGVLDYIKGTKRSSHKGLYDKCISCRKAGRVCEWPDASLREVERMATSKSLRRGIANGQMQQHGYVRTPAQRGSRMGYTTYYS